MSSLSDEEKTKLQRELQHEMSVIHRNLQDLSKQMKVEEDKLEKLQERAALLSSAMPGAPDTDQEKEREQGDVSQRPAKVSKIGHPAPFAPMHLTASSSSLRSTMSSISFVDAVKRPTLLSKASLLKLKRFDTPTISNGIEMITKDPNYGSSGFNLEHVLDHMPDWGTMIGYAVTVRIQPSNRALVNQNLANRQKFTDYVSSLPKDVPKIIVVEDLDVKEGMQKHGRPFVYGSMWGEVNANFFVKMGARGCITDGAVRDLPEIKAAGFRAMSRTLSPSHSYGGVPLDWDVPVEVFGTQVRPGQLIAADRHGFQVIPEGEVESKILQAAEDGDGWERDFTIASSWAGEGNTFAEVNARMADARGKFGKANNDKYGSFEERMGSKQWWAV
eukprot:TRINITY_DN4729_c0_g5_i1.p1 TRINITY_DN4729_c0_g5~~TRINITY_DN4729_c0_g5_i1.p1  ORF type:complete len:388 (+),score=68.94 TRINITY_DN4729_c0_g5_i1:119-1282(+)